MQMRPSLIITALAAGIAFVAAQDLSSLSECSVSCYNSVIASGLNCDSGDNACLCANPNFGYGLRDCAVQACTPEDVAQVASYSQTLCAATVQEPGPSAPPLDSPTAPAEPPATPTPQSSLKDESLPSTSSQEIAPSSGPASLSTEVAALEPSTTTATTMATVTTGLDTSSILEPAPARPTDPQGAGEGSQDNEKAEGPASTTPLTTPAIVGIGVGAGVAALGSGLALYLLLRRRRSTRVKSLQISQPLPGSGRDYSGGIGSVSDRNLTELEAKSKRYEDMIPRQSPRSMI